MVIVETPVWQQTANTSSAKANTKYVRVYIM